MLQSNAPTAVSFPLIRSIRSFLAAQNYWAILAVVLLVVAIRLPIDYVRFMTTTDNDFGTHIYYALDLLAGRPIPSFTMAHPLWQVMLIGVLWLTRGRVGFWESGMIFQVLSSVAAALIVYFWYGSLPGRPSPWKRAFWAVTLVLIAPVILPPLLDGAYYFGYIGLANYHNPTVHVLRPFALLMFIFANEVIADRHLESERPRHSPWLILASAVVIVLATLLKPNYTIVLLPALGLMVLYRLVKRQSIDWWLLIFGLGLPAVAVLSGQFLMTYMIGDEPEGGILFRPFAVASRMSGFLPLKFLLSVFFPLVVTGAFFRRVVNDRPLIFAWLGFAIGAAQFYLLSENASRMYHGNFLWGAQTGLFILFVVTIRFLLKQEYDFKSLLRREQWIQYSAYLPHILGGIAYYAFCLLTPHYG